MSVRGIRKSGNIIHVLPGLRFRFLYISFTCNDPPLIRNVEKGIMVTSKKATTFVIAFCDPVGIRTQDLRLRRPLLYPAELQTHALRLIAAAFTGKLARSLPYRAKQIIS